MIRQDFYRSNNSTRVRLDGYISDLNLEISPEGYSCQPMCKDGFAYMWAGAKATYGIRKGKVCFEVKVAENLEVSTADFTDIHVVRVGWSTDATTLQLGEDKNSFGYGGTAKKSEARRFIDYGRRFDKGDVIGCYLAIENGWADISYCVNGRHCGSAFKVRWNADEALYPHVLSKNCRLEINFGQAPNPYFSLLPGYKLIDHLPVEMRVPAVQAPPSKRDCEVIMMVGLPGVGKSTWAMNYTKIHPSKKYNILGTDAIIDKMRVQGLPRKNNFGGRWDVLIKQASECFNALLKKASNCNRNLILDQTNVYASARKRKVRQYKDAGYTVNAMVLVPTDEDMMRRSHQRTLEEGKEVPEAAVYDMKANFSLPHESENLFSKITFLELQRQEAENLVLQYNSDANMKGYKSNKQSGVGANENQQEKNESNRRSSTSTMNRRDNREDDRGSRSYDRADDSRYRSAPRQRDSPVSNRYRDRSPEKNERRERRSRWEEPKETSRYDAKKRVEADRITGPPEKYRRDSSPMMRPQQSGREGEKKIDGNMQLPEMFKPEESMTRNTQPIHNFKYGAEPEGRNYTQEERRRQYSNSMERFPPQQQRKAEYPNQQNFRKFPPKQQGYIKLEEIQDNVYASGSQDMDWEYPPESSQSQEPYVKTEYDYQGIHRENNPQFKSEYEHQTMRRKELNMQKQPPLYGASGQMRPGFHGAPDQLRPGLRNPPGGAADPNFQQRGAVQPPKTFQDTAPNRPEFSQRTAPGQYQNQQEIGHQNSNKTGHGSGFDENQYYQDESADYSYHETYDQSYSGHQSEQQYNTGVAHPGRGQRNQHKDEYVEDGQYYASNEQNRNRIEANVDYEESYSQRGSDAQYRNHTNATGPNEAWKAQKEEEMYDQYGDDVTSQTHYKDPHVDRGQLRRPLNMSSRQPHDPNFPHSGDQSQFQNSEQYQDTQGGGDANAWNQIPNSHPVRIRHPLNQGIRPNPQIPHDQIRVMRPQLNHAVRPMASSMRVRGAAPDGYTAQNVHGTDNQHQEEVSPLEKDGNMPHFVDESQVQWGRQQMNTRPQIPGSRRPLLRGEIGIRQRFEGPVRYRGPRPGQAPPLRPHHPELALSQRNPNVGQGFMHQQPHSEVRMIPPDHPPHAQRDESTADSTIQKLTNVDFDNLKASLANIRQAQLDVRSETKHSYQMTDQEILDMQFPGEHRQFPQPRGRHEVDQQHPVDEGTNQYPGNEEGGFPNQLTARYPPDAAIRQSLPLHEPGEHRIPTTLPERLPNRKPLLPNPDVTERVTQYGHPTGTKFQEHIPEISRGRMHGGAELIQRPPGARGSPSTVAGHRPGPNRNRALLPDPVENKPMLDEHSYNEPENKRRADSRSRGVESPLDHEKRERRTPDSRERSRNRERRSDRDSRVRDDRDSRDKRESRGEKDSRDFKSERDSRSRRESRRDSRERDSRRESDSRRTRDRDHDRSSRRENTRWERSPHSSHERKSQHDRHNRSRSPTHDRRRSTGPRAIPVEDIKKIKSELELERAMLQAKKEAMEQAKREICDSPAQKIGEWDQLAAVQSLLLKDPAGIGEHSEKLPSLLDLPSNGKPGLLGPHPLTLGIRPQLRLASDIPGQLIDSPARIERPPVQLIPDPLPHPLVERSPNVPIFTHEPQALMLENQPGPLLGEIPPENVPTLQVRAPGPEVVGGIQMRFRGPAPRPALLETPVHPDFDTEDMSENINDEQEYIPNIPQQQRMARPLMQPRMRGPRPGMSRFSLRIRNPGPPESEFDLENPQMEFSDQIIQPPGPRPQRMRLRGIRPRMGSPGPREEIARIRRPEGARPLRMRLPMGAVARRPIHMAPGRFPRPMRPRIRLEHDEGGSNKGMFHMARPIYRPAQRIRHPRPRFENNMI